MTIAIRPAEERDAPAIRRIHLSAFATSAEADLIERLDSDGDLVLSLVAEDQGEAIGHLALSRMQVAGEREYRALGLGPIGVAPSGQGSGAGSALIDAAIAIAEALREELIFVLGEPDYYRRFGFSAEIARPFDSPYSGPYFMARALQSGFRLPERARADYAAAFAAVGAAQ